MRDGSDPYKLMGVNPRAPALGLKKIRHGSNQEECAIKTKKCKICNKEFVSDKFSICTNCRESKRNNKKLNPDLKGNEPAEQMKAIESLSKLNSIEALTILIKGLNHDDSNVRWKIARQLGHLKNKRAVLPLIDTLKDSDSIVRNNAIWSLGEIGDMRAIEPLKLALKDRNKVVRYSAKDALNKINI